MKFGAIGDDIRAHLTGVGQIYRRNSSNLVGGVAQVLTGELSIAAGNCGHQAVGLTEFNRTVAGADVSVSRSDLLGGERYPDADCATTGEEVDLTKAELTDWRCLLAEQKASHDSTRSELIDASVALRSSATACCGVGIPDLPSDGPSKPRQVIAGSKCCAAGHKSPTLRKSKTVRVAYSKARSISVFQDSAKRRGEAGAGCY